MKYKALYIFFIFLLYSASITVAEAASLRISPDTGVYTVGSTFTTRVIMNTSGQSVNAAEGMLSFNPRELSVISATRSGSIFNLWTQEPAFSNGAGTITFGGGSPAGYTGSAGTVMSVTFRALNAGTPKITFSSGSILAADGRGTNVLTSMTGGTYTIGAATVDPKPEPVYLPSANTPARPVVHSSTHPDQEGWYSKSTAKLSWTVPSGVTSVRTLLDEYSGTIPTKVYDTPINDITIEELEEGVSYFHIQFRNSDGWGAVAHYRLAVDNNAPSSFVISETENKDSENPQKILLFTVEDISPITKYIVQIDGGAGEEYLDEGESGEYALPSLAPGRHTMIVEAFDSAHNSLISTYSFDILAFDKPLFTDYPTRLNTEVIPVFRGITKANAEVTISISRTTGSVETVTVVSDENGVFTFIPDTTFERGVYDLRAIAKDEYGAQSDPSEQIRIIVEEPGYIRIGSFVINILSVIVPLIALLTLLVFGLWYLWHKLVGWRKRVIKETKEAEHRLAIEFDAITSHLGVQIIKLKKSRKGKLTKAEGALIDEITSDIDNARVKILKEISDIDDVVQ